MSATADQMTRWEAGREPHVDELKEYDEWRRDRDETDAQHLQLVIPYLEQMSERGDDEAKVLLQMINGET